MFRRRVIPFDDTPQHVRPESLDYDRWASVPLMAYDPGDGLVPAFNLPEYVRWAAANAIDIHLLMIHNARAKLIATYLPEASVIVDLGAAAGSIYRFGYPYKFHKLIVVDLPPDDRHNIYREKEMVDVETPYGPVTSLYSSMDDLSAIPSGSVDLVWSGQSMEHITAEQGDRVCAEVHRILRPGGQFCLDTPNRLMTEIHLAGYFPFSHPEHKVEYYPDDLQKKLIAGGFTIVEALGLCEMIRTRRTGAIDYRDFYASSGVNSNVNGSYIQYYRCVRTRDLPPQPDGSPAPGIALEPVERKYRAPRGRWQKLVDLFLKD
ncbi:MAG TPA: class I SAM-dependent methyltransferase [Isosphaeraceae bacterium]